MENCKQHMRIESIFNKNKMKLKIETSLSSKDDSKEFKLYLKQLKDRCKDKENIGIIEGTIAKAKQ